MRNVSVQIKDWGELKVGRPAQVRGMTKHVTLNGVIVVLKEFDEALGAWMTVFANGEERLLKTDNLNAKLDNDALLQYRNDF